MRCSDCQRFEPLVLFSSYEFSICDTCRMSRQAAVPAPEVRATLSTVQQPYLSIVHAAQGPTHRRALWVSCVYKVEPVERARVRAVV